MTATTSDRRSTRRHGRTTGSGASAVIALEHVSLAFERPVLEDVSLEIYAGETMVIVGESGTGKSTILKLVSAPPDAGRGPGS